MKKIIALLLVAILTLSFASCSPPKAPSDVLSQGASDFFAIEGDEGLVWGDTVLHFPMTYNQFIKQTGCVPLEEYKSQLEMPLAPINEVLAPNSKCRCTVTNGVANISFTIKNLSNQEKPAKECQITGFDVSVYDVLSDYYSKDKNEVAKSMNISYKGLTLGGLTTESILESISDTVERDEANPSVLWGRSKIEHNENYALHYDVAVEDCVVNSIYVDYR